MAVTGFVGGGLKLSFFDEATSLASTITVPNGVQAGWLIVLVDNVFQNGTVPNAVPSGFAAAVNTTGSIGLGAYRQIISYKIAAGTEGGTNLTGMNVPFTAKALAVFRSNKPLTAINAGDPDGVLTAGNPSAQTLAASGGTPALVALAAYCVNNTASVVDPRVFTIGGNDAKDGEINSFSSGRQDLWLAYKIMNKQSQLANITVDMDDEGEANILQSVYLECSA